MNTFGQGSALGRYVLGPALGAGGFATVYRAWDPTLEREVALKVLHPHMSRDPQVRERFLREGRALARVRHPGIVTVYEAGEAGETAFLATDLIEGRSLSDLLAERGPFSAVAAATLAVQIGAALDAVHARGLVHRDVKPANIMIETATGRAILLDLGIARDAAHVSMTGAALVGTPAYMAPEQVQAAGEVSPRTDVYQLGATLYAVLTGHPPFEGDTIQVLTAVMRLPPPDLMARRPDVPVMVAGVLAQAMAKDPALRPPSPGELARRLSMAGTPPAHPVSLARGAGPVALPQPYGGTPSFTGPAPAPVTGAWPYASLGRRAAAAVVDYVLGAWVFGLIAALLLGEIAISLGLAPPEDTAEAAGDAATVIFLGGHLLFLLVYDVLFEAWLTKATPGRLMLGVRVRDQHGGPSSAQQVLGRELMRLLSTVLLFLGFLGALGNPRRQTMHDSAAHTVVLRKPPVLYAPPMRPM